MDANQRSYQITGRVISAESRRGVAGLRVEAWDTTKGLDAPVASAITGRGGEFRIDITEARFGELFGDATLDMALTVSSGHTQLAGAENSVAWNPAAGNDPVEITVPWSAPQAKGPPPGQQQGCGDANADSYNVRGKISSSDRAGTGGLHVQIVDKSVGEDFVYIEAIADPCGSYAASFPATLVADRGKLRPDVQAKVLSNGAVIATSDVYYNAPGSVTLNVLIPPGTTNLPSEHDTLLTAIRAHYNGSLDGLQENDNRKDITFLANKSGWDARTVAMAALAEHFSALSTQPDGTLNVPAPFFYALFRAGLPANENTLFHTDTDMLNGVWTAAIDQGLIDASHGGEIPDMLGRFLKLSGKRLLTDPPVTGPSTLRDMLATSGLNAQNQQQFATLYADNRSDPDAFWDAVGTTLGEQTANQLKADGKLAYLTINNAPLMAAARVKLGGQQFKDAVQLVDAGFHRAENWLPLLEADMPIPDQIPGADDGEKRANYADYLAAQVSISFPTATVAKLAADGDLHIQVPSQVSDFLTAHRDAFEIGAQPVEQFIAQNQLDVDPATVTEVKRVQRVYQLTGTDDAMIGLLNTGLDSATSIARFNKDAFVDAFGDTVGGPDVAGQIHDRSVQIHNVTLNLAISYLAAKNGIQLGNPPLEESDDPDASRQILQPAPQGPVDLTQPHGMRFASKAAPFAGDVLAYATLDTLFGSMDFCTCDHCRSVLSPAAYLVDLLHYVNQPHPPAGTTNPQTVLLQRRPDLQHLPLTCENTNTALPYIDVVNETLEYFIANTVVPLSLTSYVGHDTGTAATEDLLASPMFVMDTAYTALAAARFPLPLPFNKPLETLRRTFEKFNVPLPLAMDRLRLNENLERLATPYAWRDILMEELRLSREEYEILTDSVTDPLWRMYGFPGVTADATVIAGLSNAKGFCTRLDLTYEELTDILQTRFINPNSDLIPKIARLGVDFYTMQRLNLGLITPAAFVALFPGGPAAPDPAEYGAPNLLGIAAWVTNPANYSRIMSLVTLVDVTGAADSCTFATLELRYSTPMGFVGDTSTRIGAAEYIRLLRFVRLWKKLGWTIEQTDDALCALFTLHLAPLAPTDIDTASELDAGFLRLLPRLGIIVRAMKAMNLTVDRDLASLLACWTDIDTHGPSALYRRMFLTPTILNQDPVYADNGYGEFLQDPTKKVIDHAESLRAAFSLSGDEFNQIFTALGYTGTTVLNVPNISAMFRRGYLARALRISVRELLMLSSLTGLDPFVEPNLTAPAMMALAGLLADLKETGLSSTAALYLMWNQDLSGTSAPGTAAVNDIVRTLRADYAKIDVDFSIVDDPTGEIARARMTLAYGTEAADFFFGLLNDTFVSETNYNHVTPTIGLALAAAIAAAAGTYGSPAVPRVGYDDFHKHLTFTGRMTTAQRTALLAVAVDGGVVAEVNALAPGMVPTFQADFTAAVNALYTTNSGVIDPFFARYSELLPYFLTFMSSPGTPEARRTALLANILPALIGKRKTQQALQRLADAAQTDRAFAEGIVNPSPVSGGLHAAVITANPAVKDLIAVETPGLSAQYYDGVTVAGFAHTPRIDSNLVYAAATPNPLPPHSTSPGSPISGIWSGSIEAPESGFYNIVIAAEGPSGVSLNIDGAAIPLAPAGTVWRNTTPLEFKAGALSTITVTIVNITNTASIQWETSGRGLAPIPAKSLYPASLYGPARDAYLRFLKSAALAAALKLTAAEVARPVMAGVSWLNSLTVTGTPLAPTTFLAPLRELLDYAHIKIALSPGSDSLLTIVRNPAAATATPTSLLYTLTGWDAASVSVLLARFGAVTANLATPSVFRRVLDAFSVVRLMGVSASALIAGTTNAPIATIVRDLQAALRARYAAADWRDVVQSINDQMRSLQRNALVAYILHQFRSVPSTAHINTPDKLFEYFLMDVQMEPCMQTSRVRHAIAAVQLFVDRCLLNLEPRCSPASLNAEHWEWMKRYRVWEANRKVFLYPENWLEPELRDDKSPFFKEIETELLQSDVTEETAAVALLNYLAKLEEVAKLEPCGFYHIEANPSLGTGDVDHVIARTAGAHRKHFYRRREYGYWTAWEQVKLDIEDNPITPVIWKNRLLLFWLRIVKRGPDSAASAALPTGTNLGDDLSGLHLPPDPNMTVQVILCWSEYYNGKWQAAKTSDVERPVTLATSVPGGASAFDRSALFIEAHPDGDGLRINVSGWGWATFLLYNMHSLPLTGTMSFSVVPTYERMVGNFINELSFGYITNTGFMSMIMNRLVLKPNLPYSLVQVHHPLNDPWNAPLFYQDARHVFYVSSRLQLVPISTWSHYGIPGYTGISVASATPGMVFAPAGLGTGLTTWATSPSFGVSGSAGGAAAMATFVAHSPTIQQGIGSTALVPYGGAQIGPAGAVAHV